MTVAADVRHEYAQINGIRMHYAIAGSGPLVLLLHGFPDFWYTWRRQIGPLAERFTVVAPDQRGYHETDKPGWGYSVDVLVTDALELARALGHERVMIVGHDWGGAVAWAAAIARPHRVSRLVSLNIPHPAIFAEHLRSNPRQLLRSSYMGFFQLPWLPELALSAGDYAVVERELRRDLRDRISDAELQAHKDAISTPGTLTGGLNWYRAAARQGTRGLYAGTKMRCEVPTLIIHGDRDPYLGQELFAGNERFTSDLRVRAVPGAGHWVHQWAPEVVNAELIGFLGGA
jgi:pimeloyl-ACP methyl ester carboxylesterase